MNHSKRSGQLTLASLLEYLQLFEPLIFFLLPPNVLSDLRFIPPNRGHVISPRRKVLPHKVLRSIHSLCCVSLSLLLVEPERFTIWRLSFDSRKCQTLRVPQQS